MMQITLHELAHDLESNLLALILFALALNLLQPPLRALPPRGRSVAGGLLFGAFAVASVTLPALRVTDAPFDVTVVALLMVAPLFGFTAQAIATAIAVAGRLTLAGTTTPASLLVILLAYVFGGLVARSMGYSYIRGANAPRSLARRDMALLSILALLTAVIGYGEIYLSIARHAESFASAAAMLLLWAPAGTAVFGAIVRFERRRRDTDAALVRASLRLEAIARNLPAVLYQRGYRPDGGVEFRYVSPACKEIMGIEPEVLVQDATRLMDVVHPEDLPKVREVLRVAALRRMDPLVAEYRIIRPDGQTRWMQSRSQLLHGPGPDQVAEGIVVDITAQKEAEARADWLRDHDAMTALNNRQALLRVTDGRLADLGSAGLLLLDLDKSALVNELFGDAVGDERLVEVARRLKAAAPEGSFVARTGGDSFAVLIAPAPGVEALVALAASLISTIGKPMESGGQRLPMSPRVGIAVGPTDGEDALQLFQAAAIALEATRDEASPSVILYSNELRNARMERRAFDEDLARAIDGHEITLVYQPIVTCADRQMVGREALARWNRPGRGPVSPELFVSRAEATGLWSRLDEQVLMRACTDAQSWGDDSCISVNLSAAWFKIGDVVPLVGRALAQSGLRPHRLLLEITERVLIEQHDAALVTIERLHALGVRISIDDFGAVYSSLGYLHRLPVDEIKLDRSFILDVGTQPRAQKVVAALLELCRTLDIDVVAEGVETEAQCAWLAARGCPMVQGYLTGRPGPVDPRGGTAE